MEGANHSASDGSNNRSRLKFVNRDGGYNNRGGNSGNKSGSGKKFYGNKKGSGKKRKPQNKSNRNYERKSK